MVFLLPASSLHVFWITPSGSQQVPEHWNTTSFQQFSPLKATSPVKYLHRAGMVLICQWILTSMQSNEETSHSKDRIRKVTSATRNIPGKLLSKLWRNYSLSSWEAHCNVSAGALQDVWSRWFNHIKFLVLPTWLNKCPLFLQQQQVPFTILRSNTCTTH